jgi:hypothetical protein
MEAASRRREPSRYPAGLRPVVPGWPQLYWGQRERAAAYAGGWASALAVALFAWGTLAGAALAAVAAALHASAIADAIEQGSFPGFGRVVPRCAGLALALLGYGPLLALALCVAAPVRVGPGPGLRGEGYLVNRLAYESAPPRCGDWVCFRRPADGAVCLGRLLAGPGQEVGWRDGGVRVDGRAVPWWASPPLRSAASGEMRVPEGLAWVESWAEDPASGATLRDDAMVALAAIEGRAWAQHWPILSRRLLPSASEAPSPS